MDFYEVLEVSHNASQEEIKKSYQELIRKHHPDKNAGDEVNLHLFLKIDEAYKVLKDPLTKKEYDSKLFQEKARCQMIIHDTVDRTEFVYDENEEVFYHVCKCGDWYILDESSLEEEYIISCDECSLNIKVLNKRRKESK